MKKVLLHICCGICAAASVQRLKADGFEVEGFFFNPNIHPAREYIKRKKAAGEASKISKINLIEAEYDADSWFKRCQALKNEPEGGKRCLLCYEMRLKKTLDTCLDKGFDYFTTTLSISPHKNSAEIFEVGKRLDKDRFLAIDFKEKDGFKNTMESAKKYNLYRQSYCGCIYSMKKQDER